MICVRSDMQSLVNIYCSEKLIRGVQNQVIYLSVIYILLGITAVVGNTLFLIALHKNTSLHQPSKVLLRNLVASRSLHWFRATYFRCFADLHSVRMVANLSSSLFRQWYSSQPFDNSIIVDHNRHLRRQTFGSVVKTQVQTSGHH